MKNLFKKIYRYIFSKIIWEIYKRKKITATIIFPEPIPVQKNKPKLKDEKDNSYRDPLITVSIKSVSIKSAQFALATDGTDLEKQNEHRKRFYLKLDGIYFPEAWDELSEEYKKERLDRLDIIGIES